MSESLVGFGHLVEIFSPFHRSANAVRCVEDLVGQSFGHGALPTFPGVADQPADGQGGCSTRPNLDRHLVGCATDSTAANLQLGADVVNRTFKCGDRISSGLLADDVKGAIDDALGSGLLA